MFELKDYKRQAEEPEESPERQRVVYGPIVTYGSAEDAYPNPKFEDGDIFVYFKSKRISRTWVRWWMGLQVALLIQQLFFYQEVSYHSALYDSVVESHCNVTKVGSCKSRLWQEYMQVDHLFNGVEDIRRPIPIVFATTSQTPLSVQISVIPTPTSLHIPFEMLIKRKAKGDLTERTFYERGMTGFSSVILTEGSHHPGIFSSPVHRPSELASWEGTVTLADFPHPGHGEQYIGQRTHASAMLRRVQKELRSVKILVGEMNNVEMLEFGQKAKNCQFEKSWSNVMLQSMNLGSRRLSWIATWLMCSVIASTIVSFLVWNWYGGRRTVDGLNFHYLVVAKCVLQDLPLQIILMYYIFSWYEGAGGERCQLCMLDLEHCDRMTPFHLSNFLLTFLVLASSVSNQFLFSTDPTQIKSEDDNSFVLFARFALGCLTLLPFSTAMVAFNGSLIDVPGFFHILFLVPCFTGWVTLFSLICLPITSCLDNDEYYVY